MTRSLRAGRTRAGRKPKPRPKPRVVEPPRRRLGRFPFLVIASVLIGALVVGVVSAQALVSQTSFRMEDLDRRANSLQHEYGQLRLDVASLSSPARIAHEARKLGLRVPPSEDVHTVFVGNVSGTRKEASRPAEPAFTIKALLGGRQ
jgi:cell division protein FtsL